MSSVKYEIDSNPIVIYNAMAIVHSVSSEKTWEPLFQTLVKALRTQEAEETVLVFDNYSNNQEFFLKQQERINPVTNGRYYKNAYGIKLPKMSQGKALLKHYWILIFTHMHFNKTSTIGTCKPTKILLLMLEKFMKNLAVPLACCRQSFM